jgi:OmpA-OmpF porin, OOP family
MKRFLAAATLVVSAMLLTGVAYAKHEHKTTTSSDASADHVICKMTHPWPFRCGHAQMAMAKSNDADGDGVIDKNDKCPDTPRGAIVDANGCPMDSDHDGVPDGIDTCANTPSGVTVDDHGCPRDDDHDGVFNGVDKCPGTPQGATVDATGCPMDSDKDGVADGIDQCPGTDPQWAVDDKGCPIPVSETYQQFLDAKSVSVQVQFASGKADILPASEDDLNKVGQVLNDWPEAKVEIGGHTDSQGSDKFNKTLSQKRAESVKAWLTSHYPKIHGGNLSTKGYGESDPIADNKTDDGRAKNRRVTFTLMNAKDLGKDIETRRYKKRGE